MSADDVHVNRGLVHSLFFPRFLVCSTDGSMVNSYFLVYSVLYLGDNLKKEVNLWSDLEQF